VVFAQNRNRVVVARYERGEQFGEGNGSLRDQWLH